MEKEWITIVNKFEARCKMCSKEIKKEETVKWLKGYGIAHVKCYLLEYKNTESVEHISRITTEHHEEDSFGNEYTSEGDIAEVDTEENSSKVDYDISDVSDEDTEDGSEDDDYDIEELFDSSEEKNTENPNEEQKDNSQNFSDRDQLIEDTLIKNNRSELDTFTELLPFVGKKPLIYTRNSDIKGRPRIPKDIYEQEFLLNKDIKRINRSLSKEDLQEKIKSLKNESENKSDSNLDSKKDSKPEGKEETEVEEIKVEQYIGTKEWYLAEIQKLRKFCQKSNYSGQFVDTISMRPIIEGKKAFDNGIPLEAMLHAVTLHWSKETKETAGIKPYSYKEIVKSENHHGLLDFIVSLAKARIPILLIGDKGTGKSYIAQQVAEVLGLNYSFLSLNGATTPSWFFGNWTPDVVQPYKTRPLKELYRNGGVFCIDEIDAGEPNMLLVLNNLISSNTLHCPMTGEVITKHTDFIIIATANTMGLGATKEYRGRERLDDATLDRFRMGRVLVSLDEKLERFLLFQDNNE